MSPSLPSEEPIVTAADPVPSPSTPADSAVPAGPPELPAEHIQQWHRSGGELIDLLRRAHALGPVSLLQLGPKPAVLLTDPAGIQHVLALNPDRYPKRSHRARALLGDGVLTAAGELWKRQRRLLQSHFTVQATRRFTSAMHDAARHIATQWSHSADSGQARDITADMRFYALDVIWRALTGHGATADTLRILSALDVILTALPVLPPPDGHQPDLGGHLTTIHHIVDAAIAEARGTATPPGGPALLHSLIRAADEQSWPDNLIRDEVMTLLVAGQETTANTLAWLFLLLGQHPDERDRALRAGSAGGADRNRAFQALVSETLRLYPVAWLLPRHATEDDVVAGHRVRAGTTVLACPYLTHRDPALWPEPERFLPGRFTAGHDRPTRPGAYYPFGLGPRACLGAQFALREAATLLEHLLPAYAATPDAAPADAAFGITISPAIAVRATITRPERPPVTRSCG
ncbi:cytochrome P450 [Streptomyces sp. VNUA116]|uniref:cytochrome P450 n=1 Tax=Streptomyces sp. VNUA116 TaxID=3062449 RepID=UPI0026762F8E|nr:cytochrome P450 [Streptomyces sp. VNUA116]WKU48986.1 cytochrome P450 [Streptomyces sp. VNUA116]